MEKSGLNLKEIKARNISSILYLLNKKGEMSRKDIAFELGLTPAAVTKLCNELLDEGLIGESGEQIPDSAKAGRRKILLKLRLGEFYALCVNADVGKISVTAASLDGRAIYGESIKITEDTDKVLCLCESVIKNAGIEKEKYLCTSICVIGSVKKSEYGLWNNARLKEKAEQRLKLPVIFENNIRAFALAELIYGKKDYSRSVLFLKWGPGIGSAVMNNGEIINGSDGGVTEIGHYIVRRDGAKCRCGRYGCLETEVSAMALEQKIGNGMTFDEIIGSTDESTVHTVEEKIDTVALALANTATILNAKKIILFGTAFENDDICEKLERQCKRYNKYTKGAVEKSRLNNKISFIGAAALAAKHCFFEGHSQH